MSQTTVTTPRLSGPAQQLDDYLQQQMRKASAQVRLVDLFTSIMTLLAVFLGALFLIALVDAWVLELSPWMRIAALGTIVVSAIAYVVVVVIPLSIRRINPVYAAKVVESARPDIKNGLINYLLLRSYNREEKTVSQRVIELVGSRAANDISGVEVAGTVDKSNTIRIAMVLVAIVTVLGLYKVFSPKDPFQTFARVMAPFSDLARPARVRISDVTPGNTTVYFGQPMPVSARVVGRFDAESVYLTYSTTDGQVIDERVGMRPSEAGDGTYVVLLKTDERGIGHSLNYHIEAGDGKSVEYTMLLKSTPMLSVDSITYQPPEYTQLPELTVTGSSEISALEGTLVTLRTVANTQLQSASVELLMQRPDAQFNVVNTVSMDIVDSKRAECKFRLQLDSKRENQRYSHYRLNLVTVEGKLGEPAEPCPIRVIPDLAPEIQILQPTEIELSVPINSKIRFNIRAQDADFELSKISVAGDSSVYRVFEQDIPFPRDADLSGQINVRFDLWPKKLKLREGETIMVAFAAFDNRRIASNNAADPNRTMSVNYIIHITEPINNPPADEPEDQPESGDEADGGKSDESRPSNNEQDNPDEGKEKDNPESNDSDSKSDDGKGSGEDGDPSDSDDKQGTDPKPDESTGGDSKASDKQDDKQPPGADDKRQPGENDQPGAGTPDDSDSKSEDDKKGNANDGSGGKSSPDGKGEPDSKSGDASDKTGSESGTGSAGDTPPGGESSSDPGTADGSEQSGQTGNSDQPGEPLGDDAAPGDIIEAVNQMREQKEKSGSSSSQPESGQPNDGGSNQDNKTGGSSSQESPSSDQSNPGSESNPSGSGDKNEPESGDSGSKQEDGSNGGSDKEETQQNPGQDNNPSNEGSPSTSEDAGEKGSNDKSPSSGGSDDEKGDDKKGSSEGGDSSGDKPSEEQPKPEEKSGGGGGEEKEQKSEGSSGSKDESGSPKQSDPSRPSGKSEGKDGESGMGEPGDSGSPDSSNSEQGGTEPGEEGSASGGSPEPGSGEQKGTPEGNSPEGSGDKSGSEGSGKEGAGNESQQPGSTGESPGEQPGSSSSQPGDNQSSDSEGSGDQAGNSQEGSNAGGQPGGGATGNSAGGNNQLPPQTDAANEADKANLEYTKRATDLALDYLTEQQVNPDPELLEKLNWTEDELRDFVKRWNELRLRAENGTADDKLKYEQSLRSLGIGPGQAEVQETAVQQDKQQGYQEDARVSNAPAGFRAFEKRRNRVDEKQPPR